MDQKARESPAFSGNMAGSKRLVQEVAGNLSSLNTVPPFAEEDIKPEQPLGSTFQDGLTNGFEKGSAEKRQRVAADPSGVQCKDEMESNMKQVVEKMMEESAGERVALRSMLEVYKQEFSSDFDVKVVAGHGSFTRYVRDRFKALLKLEIDSQGEYWASSLRPEGPVRDLPGDRSALGGSHQDCGRGLEFVQSLYSVSKERDNATRVHMLVMRQLLQRKFERWMEARRRVTENGGVMPGLSEIWAGDSMAAADGEAGIIDLGVNANPSIPEEWEQTPVNFARDPSELPADSRMEESPISPGADSKPVRMYLMSNLVEDYKGCFKEYALQYEDLLQFVSRDPTYTVKTDSFGIQSIEEAESLSELFLTLLAIRQEGLMERFQELGYKNLDHLLRNTVMSDIFSNRGKTKRVDPVQNVRKFFQGQLWARLHSHPNCPVPFTLIKSAFEELYHQLEPQMLGGVAFHAGSCPRMNDIFALESGVNGALFVTVTPFGKFRWLVSSMMNDGTKWGLVLKDGVSLSTVCSKFLDHFKSEITLSEIGIKNWKSVLFVMKDIVHFTEQFPGGDFLLYPPQNKATSLKLSRLPAFTAASMPSISSVLLRSTGPRYVSLPLPRQPTIAQDIFRLRPCTYTQNLLHPIAPLACMNSPIGSFPHHVGLTKPAMTLAQPQQPPPPPPPPPPPLHTEKAPAQKRITNSGHRLKWVTSDFTPEIIQDPLLKGRRGKMWETSWETLGVNPGMKLSSESGGPTGPRRQTVSVNGLKGTAEELKPWGV